MESASSSTARASRERPGSEPPAAWGSRMSWSCTLPASASGSTPTCESNGRVMVSCCCRSASSRCAGVSSGWFDDAAWPVAALKAALVLFVQRSGSIGTVRFFPLGPCGLCSYSLMPYEFLIPCSRSAPVRHGRLAQRHQVAPVLAVGGRHGVERLRLHPGQLGLQLGHLGLELEHPTHPLEVEPGRRQLLYVAQPLQVELGAPPAPATRARRVEQALALVDAQRLRVHAGELGRHRNDVDRRVGVTALARAASGLAGHAAHPSTASRGAASVTAAGDSHAARCSSVLSVGTSTSLLTMRSPRLAPLRPEPLG